MRPHQLTSAKYTPDFRLQMQCVGKLKLMPATTFAQFYQSPIPFVPQSVTEFSPEDLKFLQEWDPGFSKVKHMVIFEDDHPRTDLLKYFPKAVHFIESAIADGGKVFVHCMQGISRSATVRSMCRHFGLSRDSWNAYMGSMCRCAWLLSCSLCLAGRHLLSCSSWVCSIWSCNSSSCLWLLNQRCKAELQRCKLIDP